MNQAIRTSWIVAVAMFTLLFGSLTYVQFIGAETLTDNPLNRRTVLQNFGDNRGSILVDGKPIAESVETDGQFPYQRVYNEPNLYAHLTGFFSLSHGATQLESTLQEQLTGTSDSQFFDRMAGLFNGSMGQGASVELTIDPQLQQLAWDLIPEGQQGSIVVMEPSTGDILAMVSKPSYDPNLLAGVNTQVVNENIQQLIDTPGLSPYLNPATQKLLAPGSVFKIIDVAAALESDQYDAESELPNPQNLELEGTTYQLPNYVSGQCSSRSVADFAFALAHSCNTAFAGIALELGQDTILKEAREFGFSEQLFIPTRVEASQFPEEELNEPQLAQSAIGQYNVKATPLQIAMMTAAIANDGVQMKPQLVRSVRAPDLRVIDEPQPEVLNTSTSPEVANQITEWMIGTTEGGTATGAQIPGVDVASKTGTAELLQGTTGNNSWYTGFAPAEDPKVVVTIVIENVDVPTGAQLTSPNAKRILEAVLNK